MIRIWNYNKSRIHSFRGAKDLSIALDGAEIFSGEIRKAPGILKGLENTCEYILFVREREEANILEKLEKNDWLNNTA
jgi:hypothetical protein